MTDLATRILLAGLALVARLGSLAVTAHDSVSRSRRVALLLRPPRACRKGNHRWPGGLRPARSAAKYRVCGRCGQTRYSS
jgi:hypothetical protein